MNWKTRYVLVGVLLTALILLRAPFEGYATDDTDWSPIGKVDVSRIEELYHINDILGDSLWPGFSSRDIPIAINNENKQELLIGHPSPPDEFEPFEQYGADGQTICIREGCTRYGPKSGGWAIELGGEWTAYVGALWEGPSTEDYLSLIMHECFHVFQRRHHERADGIPSELPELDAGYSAMICLESAILSAALTDTGGQDIRNLAEMFVAVRQERRKNLSAGIILAENEQEFDEGTATYIQARMYQLLANRGGIEPLHGATDPRYDGFRKADSLLQIELDRITPPRNLPTSFFHSAYHNGMAECMVLDLLRPRWKTELGQKGVSQFNLLEREFPLDPAARTKLVRAAKEQYEYDSLLTEQKRIVDARIDTLLSMLEAPGLRYRIYFSKLESGFKWKPNGPVYQVPTSLMTEVDERLGLGHGDVDAMATSNHGPLIWGGGFSRFEIGEFVFESRKVPILFRLDFFEWIDQTPETDGSDCVVKYESKDGDVYTGLVMITDAFELRAPKARIDRSDLVVAVYPIKTEGE